MSVRIFDDYVRYPEQQLQEALVFLLCLMDTPHFQLFLFSVGNT